MGHWVNEEGGVIDFYAGSTGHIPPFEEGNLPSYAFSYTIPDETHIAIKFEGVADELVVGIRIEDDKMTWRNPSTGAETVYTRGK